MKKINARTGPSNGANKVPNLVGNEKKLTILFYSIRKSIKIIVNNQAYVIP